MRVLQAMAGGAHGGAELFFVRLAEALARAGVEQGVVVRPEAARIAALRQAGIPTRTARFGGPLDVRTRLAFGGAVRRFRPRIVLTWMSRATAACPRGGFAHIARLGGDYDLKYYRRCDHLIANSDWLRARIVAAGWAPERVSVIGNFASPREAAPADRSRVATPGQAPLLLALGRLHPSKGFDVLIEAMGSVPGAYLWIAGEGALAPELAALAERRGLAGRVRFLGWREDVAALMAAADIVVVPSRREPLGNVVLEAWAQARPVVAAAAEGPRELIADGVDGLLAAVDDPAALADALRRLLDDAALRARLGAAGRATLEARHGEAAVVARYQELFTRFVG